MIDDRFILVKSMVVKRNLHTLFVGDEDYYNDLTDEEKDLVAYVVAIASKKDKLKDRIDFAKQVNEAVREKKDSWCYVC